MMKYEKTGVKKNLGISLISSWLEEAMEQEHRSEYRAPSLLLSFTNTNWLSARYLSGYRHALSRL